MGHWCQTLPRTGYLGAILGGHDLNIIWFPAQKPVRETRAVDEGLADLAETLPPEYELEEDDYDEVPEEPQYGPEDLLRQQEYQENS